MMSIDSNYLNITEWETPDMFLNGSESANRKSSRIAHPLRLDTIREQMDMQEVFVAAYLVLLYRYAGQNDIVIGVNWKNQRRQEHFCSTKG